jgi:uncharacterized membrane protein
VSEGAWSLALQTSPPVLHSGAAGLVHALEWVAAAVDVLSILVMLVGVARFVAAFVSAELGRPVAERARVVNFGRMELGRYILAGLELFIVSDIIHAALSLALVDLVFLALLVAIRTVIAYSLEREMRDIREDPEL